MNRSMFKTSVGDFVDDISGAIAVLSGKSRDEHRREALLDASALVLAIIDSDGRATDTELNNYLDAVAPLLDPPLFMTPMELRSTALISAKQQWIEKPSTLLDLLLRGDARDGTSHGQTYYERALDVAHSTAALDLVPSHDEIAAIDQFRSTMLAAFDGAGIPRPGAVRPPTPDGPSDQPRPPGRDRPVEPGPTVKSEHSGSSTVTTSAAAVSSPETQRPMATIAELLAELDGLIGLSEVKAEVRRLTSLLRVQQLRADQGLPTVDISHHLVFTGNPGTGKTTVARLLSQIFRSLGVVSKGHLVETDRSSLVAGYVGQTATKTLAALQGAVGGMLLIDEAYSLARGGEQDFGREAIDTLVKFMEDHRDDLAVVAAGYPAEMAELIDTNPGLKSRFTRTMNFPDYTVDELVAIFERLGAKQQYLPSEGAVAVARAMIATEPRTRGFGNARFVRNLFEAAVAHQAARIAPLEEPTVEELTTLIAVDIVPVDK